ncbi:MAG: alpha-L-fucosidase [Azoarcus sp.]|nr:MAG: alpha-L-fucosidase [Azoarcus sp.]
MALEAPALLMPLQTLNPDGTPRSVGVELEMNGFTLDALAGIVAESIGARIGSRGRYERVLIGDAAGEWVIELDFALLKQLGREHHDEETLAGGIGKSTEEVLSWLATPLVPLEVVSPPLPMARLGEVEGLIAHLHKAGARGTSDSLVNAFGMQLNVEIPGADADSIAAYLKAFLCLYDWLFARADIDVSRRVTSYVDPFPVDYVTRVLAPGYRPDRATLIEDYLDANPTRNRALDLLPLFLELDAPRVRRATDDPRIKPRPAFHYRLPDCEIGRPGWGLHCAWNDWIEVERLAADPERLSACGARYLEIVRNPIKRLIDDWADEVERKWLAH